METKHAVHNLIILDESGSMESIKTPVIDGFNELVQSIKRIQDRFPEQEHFISLITFNGAGIKTLHWKEPVSNLKEINAASYSPKDMTPLIDTLGIGISRLKSDLYNTPKHNVLVTVFSDGCENASREYEAPQVRKQIDKLKKKNWTFTYIGTDHDVEGTAFSVSISNTIRFEKNTAGLKDMFLKETAARHSYSEKLQKGRDVSDSFYDTPKQ